MNCLKKLEEEVSPWSNISVHPHRLGGREFRFGSAEVGHAHTGGVVDIPFPRHEQLRLSPVFKLLLEPFVPKTPKQVEPVPA
jgi:hypothetical protein